MNSSRHHLRADPTDLLTGIAIVGVCLAFTFGAWLYGIGTVSRMGPGFFPFLAAVIGIVLGAAVLAGAFRKPAGPAPVVVYRPLLLISAAFVVFAASIDVLGLLPAAFLAVTIAALGDRRTRLWEAGTLALAMAAFVWLIFIVLLDLPIPAIGAF